MKGEGGPVEPRELGFGVVFEASRDAIIVADSQGVVTLWNRAASALFGYEPNEARGMNVRQLVPQRLERDYDEGMKWYGRARQSPYVDSGVALELPAIRKDGIEIVVSVVLSPVPGREQFVMAIARDVTDKARLRRELDDERKRIQVANEALEAFAYVVGHDLKEPIRGILFYLDEARRAEAIADKDELLGQAEEQTMSLNRLVQRLLEWSRTSTMPLEPETLSVQDILKDPVCTVMFRQLLAERHAALTIDPDTPPVWATTGLLCQALGNLITNSLKHSDKAIPIIRVYGGELPKSQFVEIVVEDNGPGYPQQVLDQFSTTQARVSTIKGGFGLNITRRAIERLGGTLRLTNKEEGGGRAHVRLPKPPASAPPLTLAQRIRDLV